MIKLSAFYKKKPQINSNMFRQWLLTHGNQFRQHPDLEGYRINFVNEVRTLNIDPTQMEYDATSEQWFNSEDGAVLLHSLLTREEIMDIELMCLSRTVFFTEEHVIVNEPSVSTNFKLVVLLQRRSDLSVDEWRDWWLNHAQLTAQIPGLRAYRINFITKVHNFELQNQGINFDGTAQLWFDSFADMEFGFCSSIGMKASKDSDNHCDKRVRFLTEEYRVI